MKQLYIPKGGMCAICINRFKDCSSLDFENMFTIKAESYITTVRCTSFKKGSPIPPKIKKKTGE